MKSDTNLSELWSKKTTKPPQIDDILETFTQLKRKKRTELIVVNILMCITIAFIIFVWIYFEPKIITTKIGIVMTLLAIVTYMVVYNKLISYLRRTNENHSNTEFLKSILKLKEQQKFLQTTMLQIYFIMLTVGLCLYLYEYISLMPFAWSIFSYAFTIIWISFNWLYLRPKVIEKKNDKLDGIIKKYKNISEQNQNH